MHEFEPRPADQRCCPTLLRNQADGRQRLDVVREGRWRDVELGLKRADREPVITRADEGTIDAQPRRVPQRFEARCRIVEFHGRLL